MRRTVTSLRNERPVAPASEPAVVDDAPWGFLAVDGLPDLEAAPAYRRPVRDQLGRPLLTSGSVPPGFEPELMDELARIHRSVPAPSQPDDAYTSGGHRTLDCYELEVCDAMRARRDSALRLARMLAEDAAQSEHSLQAVRSGLVMDMLVPSIGGNFRRSLSEAMADFEATRHRFRLALVAVALDHGMSAVDVGAAFAFSRQLASRYMKEARAKWPELAERCPPRRRAA